MTRKASILCILVAFAICSLAQDTSTTGGSATSGINSTDSGSDNAPSTGISNVPSSSQSGGNTVQDADDSDEPDTSSESQNSDQGNSNTVQDTNDSDEPDTSSESQNSGQGNSTAPSNSSGGAVSGSGYPDQDNGRVINASTPLPQSVMTEMGSRQMRYHHFLWHQVREGWNRFTNETKQRYIDLGWEPPSPARNYLENGTVVPIPDNGSGEDFLYMHRDMMNNVKDILARNNETYTITSWKTLPGPEDTDWPVPPKYIIPPDVITENSTNRSKEDSMYNTLQFYERKFKDPATLRNMTLDELGSQIEVTIHAWLHMRWSQNCTVGFRRQYTNKTHLPYMDTIFDGPQNDWLVDTYSSHINPAFYKLHGWIDDRVEDWRVANNLTEIVWKGTWTGGPWETLSSILSAKQSPQLRGSSMNNQMPSMDHSHSGNMDVLEEVFKVFADSGFPETSVADDVRPAIIWDDAP